MKIKFLKDCKYPQNDPENSREYKAGETYDLEKDHAERWLRRGVAVSAEEKPKKKPEGMVPSPPSTPATEAAHENVSSVRKSHGV